MDNRNQFRRTTWYKQKNSTIELSGKVNSFNVKDFCAALNLYKLSGADKMTLDFSRVTNAYPNGMLPIISLINLLKLEGHNIYVKLPSK